MSQPSPQRAGRILYACVARRTAVLAEFAQESSNAAAAAKRVLERMPTQDGKASYAQDQFIYHIVVSNGIAYLCVADESFGRRVPYAFLQDIREKFVQAYGGTAQAALPYAFNDEFGRVIAQKIKYFNQNPDADAIDKIKDELDDVKGVMIENIEKVLDRGEKLDILLDKSDVLRDEAFSFRRKATSLKRMMWWKNCKMLIIIFFVLSLVIFFIVLGACRGNLKHCGKH